MAADLLENFQYGLSSSGLSGADKTVLLLKLTDPSLKCIEQYQKLKYSTSKRPAIQFKGNSGVITFPSKEAKDEGREFKFTVQPLYAPASSSFECIQQYRNRRGEHKLDSLGSIQTKVTVSGTDDVYHTTQQKMKQADQEMKKVSTKEVQQNQFKPGNRVKRKGISDHAKKIISSGVVPAVSSSSSSSYSSTTTSNFNASSLSLSSSTSSLPSLRNSYSPSSSSSSTSTTKSAIMGSSSSSSKSNRSSNIKTSSSKGGSGSSGQKSTHHNLSYRDRVVHLLALRPYKKPELLLRLHRDGIQTKEKNTLANILSQVATLARDNSYVLNKNLYNEVSTEWPLYTEEDKKLLKRRKGEFCAKDSPPSSQPSPNPPTTNSMSNGSSPSTQPSPRSTDHKPDTGAKSSSSISQKRPLLPEVRDYKTKKPRIAHNASSNQQQLSPSGGVAKKVPSPAGLVKKVPSPSSTTNTTTTVGGTSSTSQSALSSPSVSTTRNSPEMCDSTGSGSVVSMTTTTTTSISSGAKSTSSIKESSARDERQSKSAASGTKEERRPVGKESPSGDVSSTSAVPEYMMKYTNITSSEQRRRYKDDFNSLYPEYTKLHKSLESVKHKFKILKDELNKTPQDSEQHEKIQMKVINEYNKIKQDPKYKVTEERWQELHGLLDHIKALVAAYDQDKMQMDTS